MKIFNTELLSIRNVLFIAVVATITHIIAKPLYSKIDGNA